LRLKSTKKMNKFKREAPKDKESECIRTCLDLFGPSYSAEIIETICQHTNYDGEYELSLSFIIIIKTINNYVFVTR
jgi:hypothetical protein